MNAGRGAHEPHTVADLPVRKPAYMHSFGLTEHYAVLIEQPFVLDPKKLILSGRPFAENYAWEPERGTTFIVIDRRSGEVVARRRAPAMFIFHVVNAWEEDGEIVLDASTYEDAAIVESLYLDRLRGPDARVPGAELQRHRIPLGEGGVALRGARRAEPRARPHRLRAAQRQAVPLRLGRQSARHGPGQPHDLEHRRPAREGRRQRRVRAHLARGGLLPRRAGVRPRARAATRRTRASACRSSSTAAAGRRSCSSSTPRASTRSRAPRCPSTSRTGSTARTCTTR